MDAKKIVQLDINEIVPYENNPRINDEAIEKVANSIREFGFTQPIILDKENVIICGHTRRKAAILLGIKKVPCIIADWLNEQQVKALRLADNKVAELAVWNFELLDAELMALSDLDMEDFGFGDIAGSVNIDDLFEEAEPKEKKEKLTVIKCPHCNKKITINANGEIIEE